MRHTLPLLFILAACGPKTPSTPSEAPVPVTPDLPEVPEPPPPAEPEAPVANADFGVSMTFADGRRQGGRVIRVERAIDFYGASGWTDRDIKRTVSLSASGTSRDAHWDEIREIDIDYGAGASDISCQYDSSQMPWVYVCTLPTTTRATATDGSTWDVSSRQKWRFIFANGTIEEFYLFKLPVRQPDLEGGRRNMENPAMYVQLREEVQQAATTALTRIVVSE